jgi:hypothetical protein
VDGYVCRDIRVVLDPGDLSAGGGDGSAALLLMFAWAMSVSFGVKSAIDYAVFSASSAAFLLVAMCQMAAGKNKTEKSAG